MELERKEQHGKVEMVRHWQDKEIKELHKSRGHSWRSVHDHLETLAPATDAYRKGYEEIFHHK
jgi:hypothetical protein